MAQVLIAVRDADLRKLARMLLRAQYELIEASDEAEALRLLRTSADALVVLVGDWPPAVSGERILRTCEKEPELQRHVYCLVSTNYDGLTQDFRELLSRLAVSIIPVPSDVQEMLRASAKREPEQIQGSGRRQPDGAAVPSHNQLGSASPICLLLGSRMARRAPRPGSSGSQGVALRLPSRQRAAPRRGVRSASQFVKACDGFEQVVSRWLPCTVYRESTVRKSPPFVPCTRDAPAMLRLLDTVA